MTEEQEKKMMDDAFERLVQGYLKSNHRKKVDVIQKAYNFALRAHEGEHRTSGEPFMMHPIAVATIVSQEMGLGSTSICAALLHDVIDGSDYTIDDINNIFGAKIAQIVDGLTKIAGGIFGDKASAQAENFKKLLLTMSEDIRVILIKICDRLDNMRHLDRETESKQYKIAGETLYIYAPLANRLGLNQIKTELEDLSFKYEHPEEYSAIENKLAYTREQRETLFDDFTMPIRESLDKIGAQYDIKARVKSPYSIWNKMQKKHVSFDEIYDILAVRIVFKPRSREEEVNECFNIYVELCKLYKSHPDRLRDWLSHPKANGYQALHVTLMSNQGMWIEVQIRSDRMDEIAEQGFAAHWKYKTDKDPMNTERVAEDELNGWLRTIKEILDDPQPDAMDFLDAIKLNLFASEIFVFSPKGDIITMPAGGTALDFAFQIHTFLGTHCIGAKVNHKLVPLSHKLKGGDQIEIITSNSQHVQPAWINFVTTAKARNKIQALLRKQEREQAKEGERILSEWLVQHDLALTTSILDRLTEAHDEKLHSKFLTGIGTGDIVLGEKDLDVVFNRKKKDKSVAKGWRKYIPFVRSKKNDTASNDYLVVGKEFDKTQTVVITEETISQYIFPDCCKPVPGDPILAYINGKNQVEIHSRSCSEAARLKSSFGSKILAARWNMRGEMSFSSFISVRGIDRKGMLKDVATLLSDTFDINIHSVKTLTEDGIFSGEIELLVCNVAILETVIKDLAKINGMQSVHRL
ncbi:MAG: bifunctional (p)ppGpp synthetase/guanosine-3',5'-bis(diphosphate) 3'-pyrophosphohydrolase [Prevotella sp.]|nr:bifunctional (p)ppGpp synthetase/guanosine-3',5'-bis(diphosphate) 3'-pyrophosphohydrolase [Candidatus Prevotella equi]